MCKSGLFFWLITLILAQTASKVNSTPKHMSYNIDCATSTDADGWRKIPLSMNAILYLKSGTFSITRSGSSWGQTTASATPADRNTSNPAYGGAGGVCGDKAINVCGLVDLGNNRVEIQTQNAYTESVTSDVYWWAYCVEITG